MSDFPGKQIINWNYPYIYVTHMSLVDLHIARYKCFTMKCVLFSAWQVFDVLCIIDGILLNPPPPKKNIKSLNAEQRA